LGATSVICGKVQSLPGIAVHGVQLVSVLLWRSWNRSSRCREQVLYAGDGS